MALNISLDLFDTGKELVLANDLEQLNSIDAQVEKVLKGAVKRIIAANGSNRALTDVTIPANAIVDAYLFKIKAARSSYVKASLAGEVREGGSNEIIVDFGKMVTVNALRIPYVLTDFKAYAWLGAKFDLSSNVGTIFSRRPANAGQASDNLETYAFSQEVRTERLLLVFSDAIRFSTVQSDLELSLPDLPSDLSISINGGAPVWHFAGMVQAGSASQLNEDDWNTDSEILVSLAEPLRALAGDATRNDLLPVSVELSSKTPGNLRIAPYANKFFLLHRMRFDNETTLNANFEMEGKMAVTLSAPQDDSGNKTMRILGVRLDVAADFPPERALPAVGARANGVSELVLGNGRAACVRLDNIDELAHIASIRLPLSTPSSRAETRLVLWKGDPHHASEAVPEAVSHPQSWSGETEQWLKFDLPEPFVIDSNETYWVAVVVERGEVCWRLAGGEADSQNNSVRLGAPSGPWRALPAIFGRGGLGAVAARLHVIGLAVEGASLAPVQLRLDDGSPVPVTPTKEGVGVELAIAPSSASLTTTTLVVVSHAVGNLTLNNVDVITEEITV